MASNDVTWQSEDPSIVLRFDMSGLRAYSSGEELNIAIIKGLEDFNLLNDINTSWKIQPEEKYEKKNRYGIFLWNMLQ